MGLWRLKLPEDDPQMVQIKLKMGSALRLAGHLLAAEVVLDEVLARVADQGQPRARILLELGRLDVARQRHEEAGPQLSEGLKLAILAGDRQLMVELYLEFAGLMEVMDRWDRAAAELEEGIVLVSGGGTPEENASIPGLWRLLHRLARLHHHQGQPHLATISANQAVHQARGEGSLSGEATCLLWLGQHLKQQNLPAEASRHLSRASGLFRRLGGPPELGSLHDAPGRARAEGAAPVVGGRPGAGGAGPLARRGAESA